MKIAVISANLSSMDNVPENVPQSLPYDMFMYTDKNFPPRFNAMTPRLQAKIPKCFGWQMAPGYEYYLWLDSTLTLSNPDSLKYFYDKCLGYDIVVFKHPKRPDVRQEIRYTRKGIKQNGKNPGSKYILARYENELLSELTAEIEGDKDFVDKMLVNGGVFMYRDTPAVRQMLKEWWYYISRYIVQDQISFPYVLQKSGIKINVISDAFNEIPYLKYNGHRANSK